MGFRRQRPSSHGIRHLPLRRPFVSFYRTIILHQGSDATHSMSDPGTTYRTRDEVQKMRSTQDPIRGLQKYIEDWGLATEEELKAIDKESKTEVDKAVEEAKTSPEPDMNDFWTDIYYKGTEPPFMRGREREEVSSVQPLLPHSSNSSLTTMLVDPLLLDVISYRSRFFTVRLTLPSVEYSRSMLRDFRLPKSYSRPDGCGRVL